MLKLVRCSCAGLLAVLLSAGAFGKQPVFSIGAVSVDSVTVPNGFSRYVEVHPGDIMTLEVFLRNWSPGGEPMNAYQMQLEPLDFTSGSAGAVKPVGYDDTRETSKMNLDNCFVDQLDPRWIFAGRQTITLVDTRSSGYRWMSVQVDTSDALLCPQDDKPSYTGTVRLKVSDDARGTYTIGFMEAPTATLLLDQVGMLITPLEFEALTIVVRPDILAVIDRLNGQEEIPVERFDQDGDGQATATDLKTALDLLNGGGDDT